nr:unnamed protein product [Spirometra erinaceieuropaei]
MVYINYCVYDLGCSAINFAGDIKLWRAIGSDADRYALQDKLNRLSSWPAPTIFAVFDVISRIPTSCGLSTLTVEPSVFAVWKYSHFSVPEIRAAEETNEWKREYPRMKNLLENVNRKVAQGPDTESDWLFLKNAMQHLNAFVVEFIGEVISVLEANKRLSAGIAAYASLHGRSSISANANSIPASSSENAPMTFLLRLTPDLVIDAQRVGNMARFVNHSCEPNLEAKCYNVNGRLRMGLFALSALEEKEELTLDYRRSFFLDAGLTGSKSICLCGADSCVGSLRLPTAFPVPETALRSPAASPSRKSTAAAAAAPTSPKENQEVAAETREQRQQRRDKKNMSQLLSAAATSSANATASGGRAASLAAVPPGQRACKVKQDSAVESFVSKVTAAESRGPRRPLHDDFCYRCGDGGELVLCDKSNCPKSYHLNCLGLVRPPSGTWYCPWHFCDDCGHPATHLCWRCPNSYCLQHADKRIVVDELDAERWQAATKVMSSRSGEVQPSSLHASQILPVVLSCRWICIDHANVKISGPGHRPSLLLEDLEDAKPRDMKSADPLEEDVENKVPTGSPTAAAQKETEEAKVRKKRTSTAAVATGHQTPRRLKHPPSGTASRSLPKKLITAKYVKAGQLQQQKRRPRFLSMVERKRRHSASSTAPTPHLKRKRSS